MAFTESSYGDPTYGGGAAPITVPPIIDSTKFPALTVEIAFGSNPGDATQVWTDVSIYAREISIHRGRQHELDRMDPGTASVTLDNRDRRFDPTYGYYPNLLPMRRIRIRATYNGTTYDLFQGFVDGWPQGYVNPNDGFVKLTATDAFKWFANAKGPSSVWAYTIKTGATQPLAWWRLGEPTGSTVAADAMGQWSGRYVGDVGLGASPCLGYETDGAASFTNGNGFVSLGPVPITGSTLTIEMWITPGNQSQANGSFFGTGPTYRGCYLRGGVDAQGRIGITQGYTNGTFDYGETSLLAGPFAQSSSHHIAVTLNGSTGSFYLDGAYVNDFIVNDSDGNLVNMFPGPLNLEIGQASAKEFSAFEGSVDEVVVYTSILSASTIQAHYNAGHLPWDGDDTGTRIGRLLDLAGWSTSDRDLETGSSTQGPASLDASIQDLINAAADTEAGPCWVLPNGSVALRRRHAAYLEARYSTSQATYGDAAGELPYSDIVIQYDDQQIRNEVGITRKQGTEQLVTDSTSQTNYGLRSYRQSDLAFQNDNDTRSRSNWILNHYKDPHVRIESMTVKPQRDPTNMFPEVLTREIFDRVTVKRRPQKVGSAISQDVHVEGVAHRISAVKRYWEVQYQLSPADATTYWVLGDSTYGVLGSTARLGS